jgi:hypothetical protein
MLHKIKGIIFRKSTQSTKVNISQKRKAFSNFLVAPIPPQEDPNHNRENLKRQAELNHGGKLD